MSRIARDRNDSLNSRRAELERETAMAIAVVVFIGTPVFWVLLHVLHLTGVLHPGQLPEGPFWQLALTGMLGAIVMWSLSQIAYVLFEGNN